MHFNPRSPYGERQTATYLPLNFSDFNPRSPYGERLPGTEKVCREVAISIHAPLTGSDPFLSVEMEPWRYFNPRSPYGERLEELALNLPKFIFQSTLPLRGATAAVLIRDYNIKISIHAPLTGSDHYIVGKN